MHWLKENDQKFLTIMNDQVEGILAQTKTAAEKVLQLSGDFLSEPAKKALENFHGLYFSGSGTVDQKKNEVNKDVDVLMAEIQARMAQGETVDAKTDLMEDENVKKARLQLSGLQKQLETIIRLDSGLKEKMTPVLTAMQFEDMMRHRLNHVVQMWQKCIERYGASPQSLADMAENIAEMMTSTAERSLYYKTVLKRDPPQGLEDSESWFRFF